MLRPTRLLTAVIALYVAWMSMMAMHECGHVLHAWMSGGHVAHVAVPFAGFSRTDLAHNPHPLFVAWGGAIWGCVLPVGLLVAARGVQLRAWRWVQFLAGFCLIANGAYLGLGSFLDAGDAGDLMRFGTPRAALLAFGLVTAAPGLWLWHRLGSLTTFLAGKPTPATDDTHNVRVNDDKADC